MRDSPALTTTPLTRRFWVIVHRWAGLALAFFLVIAGLTGAILPFEESLGYATSPALSRAAPPHPGARMLDAVTIAERVEAQTGGRVDYLTLDVPDTQVMRLFVEAAPGHPPLGYDTVWADPFTGQIRARFTYGGVRDGAVNIVPFLYRLHYGFVAGLWGMLAFGVAALVWTIDCFVGFGLTLPVHQRRPDAPRSVAVWWRRWRPAWQIRRRAHGHKLAFDLHRASGLWMWPMLLVFAWSGVGLILPQVERPVMHLFGATDRYEPPHRAQPLAEPPIGRRAAITLAMRELAAIGASRGFTIDAPAMLGYDRASGAYALYARTSLDAVDEGGRTVLVFDATDGHMLHWADPVGRTGADRFMTWITLLHMAEVWGLPFRILVSALGLGVALLSITGVMIWYRKRRARRNAAGLKAPHPPRAAP